MSGDDRHLVLQARAGDQQAFGQLVARYQGRVYAVACGILGDPDDAMDVVQEAFIKVHRYLDRFKGSSGFYTWLYRIVVNVSIDHLRKVGRAHSVDYDDNNRAHQLERTDLVPTTFDTDPHRALTRREIRDKVARALRRLSGNHRAVILMREVEGLSYVEMAEAMQCSKGTIMSRLFHARRRMQVALLELTAETSGSLERANRSAGRAADEDGGAHRDVDEEGDEEGNEEVEDGVARARIDLAVQVSNWKMRAEA